MHLHGKVLTHGAEQQPPMDVENRAGQGSDIITRRSWGAGKMESSLQRKQEKWAKYQPLADSHAEIVSGP